MSFITSKVKAQGTIEEPFLLEQKTRGKESIAQGTIEYLIIIAVVVVISLAMTVVFSSLSSDATTTLSTNSSKIVSSSSVLSINEAVSDGDGNALFLLQNNSGETITIESITSSDITTTYSDTVMTSGSSLLFSLSDISSACPCNAGDTGVACDVTVNYLSGYSLSKTISYTLNLTCVDNVSYTGASASILVLPEGQAQLENGSSSYPFIVNDCTELQNINNNLSAYYVLGNNIDCSAEESFTPIALSEYFTGDLDGDGYTISDVTIADHEAYVSIFGKMNGASIHELGILDISITGGVGDACGALASYVLNSTITNVYATGTINSSSGIASGLIANAFDTTVTNSFADVDVVDSANGSVGGFGGSFNSGNSVSNSFTVGTVTEGGNYSGGFIGYTTLDQLSSVYWYNDNLGTETSCYNNGTIDTNTNCTIKTTADGTLSYFYSKNNAPISSFGTWENVSGSEWSTANGVWSICEGTTLPWLTTENRSC